MSIKITNIGPNPFIEDVKMPSKLIYEVNRTARRGTFNIKIMHPNKTIITPEFKEMLLKNNLYDIDLIKKIQKNKGLKGIKEIPSVLKRKFRGKNKLFKEKPSQDVLYDKNHKSEDHYTALDMAKVIAEQKFADMKTLYEDIKHIAAPPRGKMELKTRKKK